MEKLLRLDVATTSHSEMVDITRTVEKMVPAGVVAGECAIFCPHTTAGLTINENADPSVRHDMLMFLNESVPWRHPGFTHGEGNSAAHLKASMMGFDLRVMIDNGRLALGTWQAIYFCEFDGPRSRNVWIRFTPN